jgi:hypothetical protein
LWRRGDRGARERRKERERREERRLSFIQVMSELARGYQPGVVEFVCAVKYHTDLKSFC